MKERVSMLDYYFITTKFQKVLLSGFRGVALTRKTGLTV